MKANRILTYTIALAALAMGMTSCVSKGDNPGIEYAPQMYISQAYEPYSQEKKFEYNPHGMTMRLPVEGTVARGQLSYVYPNANTGEGYEASASFTSDLAVTEANVTEGERLYNYACWHCHGKKGGNDGPIFKSGKMPPPPWANVQAEYMQNLPMGKMYHTITYGKGLMGSHAAMLSPTQRWQVIYHIKSMSLGDAFEIEEEEEVMELIEAANAEEHTHDDGETHSHDHGDADHDHDAEEHEGH